MRQAPRVCWASARLEWQHLGRDRLFLLFTLLGAVNFIVVVSLFGLTGSHAPTALVDEDGGPYAHAFAAALLQAHHSFRLEPMAAAAAQKALHQGRLVAAITIPSGFSDGVAAGAVVPIQVQVDNVDLDLTDDVQRALPSAIVAFGTAVGAPGVHVRVAERDLLPHDTDYLPCLAVSGLALDALVVGGVLGAIVIARDFEPAAGRVCLVWRLAPASATAVLLGRLLAAAAVAAAAVLLTLVVVAVGYHVSPRDAPGALAALLACALIFTCLGGLLGAVVRRTQAVVPLVFGLAMPFYLNSGALEPARLDGERLWQLAHLSPAYYAVGVLERAFYGLRVTPEPVAVDLLVLVACATAGLIAAGAAARRGAWR